MDKMFEIKKYDMGWIRYVLTAVSVVIFLVACIIIGYMSWVLATTVGNQFVSDTKVFSYTVIALGFLLFFTGLVGWVGSATETLCTLKVFLVFTAVCMAVEIGGIATLNILNTQMHDIIQRGWSELNQGTRNLIQTKMECCGYDGISEEMMTLEDSCYPAEENTEGLIPDLSMPKKLFEESCRDKLRNWFEENKVGWVTGLASIGALQFMAAVVAVFIMYKVKNEKSSAMFSRKRFRELSDELTISKKKTLTKGSFSKSATNTIYGKHKAISS